MSKKESEFDRIDRANRMKKEALVESRKKVDDNEMSTTKKGGKQKAVTLPRKDWNKEYGLAVVDEYEYV